MNTQKTIKISSQFYIGFSIFSLTYVSLLSLYSPQATMDLVATTLPNNDAISSIRGIYGGVGILINLKLLYLLINDLFKGLIFLAIFWFAYAISRLITIMVDGPLGDFGTQWLVIESLFTLIGILLIWFYKKQQQKNGI